MQVQLHDVALAFPGKPALFRGLDLVVASGDLVAIRGPSGSGKSSLLRLLNRLLEPTGGHVVIDGVDAAEHDVTRLRRRIGYVQQTPVVVPGTVRDNLLLPFTFRAAGGATPPSDDALRTLLAGYLLDGVGLDDDATRLSVGQKQRVALARTLLTGPEVIACDEPTAALDPDSRRVVDAELERQCCDRGLGVVVVTHAEMAQGRQAPRVYTLTPDGLRQDPP